MIGSNGQKRIVFITGLPLWSMGKGKGAISFEATIDGYRTAGYDILLISDSKIDRNYLDVEKRIWNLSPFNSLRNTRVLGWFIRIFLLALFTVYAVGLVLLSRKWRNSSVFYGYEIFGVPSCFILGKILHRTSVSRFQGTVLYPLLKQRFWKVRFFEHWFAMATNTDLVIMADDGTQGNLVLDRIGVDRSKVRFWRNGVSINKAGFSESAIAELRRGLELQDDEIVLCTVSRLVSWKRLDRIITALPAIIEKNVDVRLLIVGDGEARDKYRELAESLNMEGKVLFAGAVDQKDVVKYLQLSDIFVSFYDLSNVGNPLMEAMTVGKPIVTINNGDTGSLIEHNVTGVLIETDALDRIPGEIGRLIHDKKLQERIGLNARAKAKELLHTWNERMIIETTEIEAYVGKKR